MREGGEMADVMYATTYEGGDQIITGKTSRVLDSWGRVEFEGRLIDCLRYLSDRGDRLARRELAARKDQ
jgi:hypothetical protein